MRLADKITKLPLIKKDFWGKVLMFFSVIVFTLVWCMLVFCLTMAEHIPGNFSDIIDKFFCAQKYSVLLGASVLIDGIMAGFAYLFLFDRKSLLMSKTGAILAGLSILCFVFFQFLFFSSTGPEVCSIAFDNVASQIKVGFLIVPILVFRYLLYQPIRDKVEADVVGQN